jgi:hypothetical protein
MLVRLVKVFLYACMGPVVFVVSVVFFPFLAALAFVGFLAIVVEEKRHRAPRWTWLRFLCGSWFILMVPTFGAMPLIIASKLHMRLPMGYDLMVSAGFTLSEIYDLFVSSPDLLERPLPFPPLTGAELYAIGCATLAFSILPIYCLLRIGRAIPEHKATQ